MRRGIAVALLGWLCACTAPALPSSAPTAKPASEEARPARPNALHYTVRVAPELSELAVRLCFEGGTPRVLIAGSRAMADAMHDLRTTGPNSHPVAVDGHRAPLPPLGDEPCVQYDVSLASGWGFMPAARRVGDAVVVDSRAWMWRSTRWNGDTRVTARFELPAGIDVALPWVPTALGGFEADGTALGFPAPTVLGRYDVSEMHVRGATLRVVTLDGFSPDTAAQVPELVRRAADAASLVLGRFPAPRVQVVAVPGTSDTPIGFGLLQRGGGASAVLIADRDGDLATPAAAWTPVHEFSHLLHPFISKRDSWLSEGLATYYQEVLRARAGILTPQQAWRRIYRGAQRCRRVDAMTLAGATAALPTTHDYSPVYWAGAMAALRFDLALRTADGARAVSLDEALAGLHACCAGSARAQSAKAVLERLDALSGTRAFTAIGKRTQDESLAAIADVDGLFEQLGIRVEGARVDFVDAPLAAHRDAIMARGASGPDEPPVAQ